MQCHSYSLRCRSWLVQQLPRRCCRASAGSDDSLAGERQIVTFSYSTRKRQILQKKFSGSTVLRTCENNLKWDNIETSVLLRIKNHSGNAFLYDFILTVNIDQFIFDSRQWQLYACNNLLKRQFGFDHPDYSNRWKCGKALFVYLLIIICSKRLCFTRPAFIRMSICLLANEQIFMKILPQMCLWIEKNDSMLEVTASGSRNF